MRNSWPRTALTSVAIAAASAAWAQEPGGAGSPSSEGTHEPTPKMQGNDSGGERNPAGSASSGANGAPVAPGTQDDGVAHSGPSPRDQPAPGLRLDDRMNRLPAQRGGDAGNGAKGSDNGANGSDNSIGNGDESGEAPSGRAAPENPANPPAPVFPANPHRQADPGAPGNPVQPTNLRFA